MKYFVTILSLTKGLPTLIQKWTGIVYYVQFSGVLDPSYDILTHLLRSCPVTGDWKKRSEGDLKNWYDTCVISRKISWKTLNFVKNSETSFSGNKTNFVGKVCKLRNFAYISHIKYVVTQLRRKNYSIQGLEYFYPVELWSEGPSSV
jgi:hypothetical protein